MLSEEADPPFPKNNAKPLHRMRIFQFAKALTCLKEVATTLCHAPNKKQTFLRDKQVRHPNVSQEEKLRSLKHAECRNAGGPKEPQTNVPETRQSLATGATGLVASTIRSKSIQGNSKICRHCYPKKQIPLFTQKKTKALRSPRAFFYLQKNTLPDILQHYGQISNSSNTMERSQIPPTLWTDLRILQDYGQISDSSSTMDRSQTPPALWTDLKFLQHYGQMLYTGS